MTVKLQSVDQRLASLPKLGVGISGEYGARPHIDPLKFAQEHPGLIHFLEFGSDQERGLDDRIMAWVNDGRRATYHFLDVNFEEFEDLDPIWLQTTVEFAKTINSPWICGDSGLWHFGPRDRGHGLLLPPILNRESVELTAESIKILQQASGLTVLPENPPSHYFLGDMHILEYFSEVAVSAECGILLDAAHLAIFQQARGLGATDGLKDMALDRVIELHIAGGKTRVSSHGLEYIDDNHQAYVQEDVWSIVQFIVDNAPNLKAICYECEHNSPDLVIESFKKLNELFPSN